MKKRKIATIAAVCSALFALFAIVSAAAAIRLTKEISVEPDRTVDLPFPAGSFLCPLDTDLSSLNTSLEGEWTLSSRLWGIFPLKTKVRVADREPPVLITRPVRCNTGARVRCEDFVVSISDHGKTELSSDDFSTHIPGERQVLLRAEDEAGNVSEVYETLTVYGKEWDLVFEAGCDISECDEAAAALHPDLERLVFEEKLHTDRPGRYHAVGETDGILTLLTFRIEDTVPPFARAVSIDVPMGGEIPLSALVSDLFDATKVTVLPERDPDPFTPGRQEIALILTDESGNVSELTSTVYVHAVAALTEVAPGMSREALASFLLADAPEVSLAPFFSASSLKEGDNRIPLTGEFGTFTVTLRVKDMTPPVISGVADITLSAGSTILYRKGVRAYDEADGELELLVDSSEVIPSVPGEYAVYYSATDSSGNGTTVTAKVTVLRETKTANGETADAILSSIILPGMSEREKARAVYQWVRNNLYYSTAAVYLMGNFDGAVASGFAYRSGNCYTYSAICSLLLDKLGIENMQIHRADMTDPHYWNLVKIGGEWYHLDACPQYPGYEKEVFLLKDSDLAYYSTYFVKGYYDFDPSLYPPTPS